MQHATAQNKRMKLVLTGGGTAGHVMPHLAIKEALEKQGCLLFYIGSNGIEKEIINREGIQFFTIQTGKLRRYFSWQNFLDIFRVAVGVVQSCLILIYIRPFAVFSKGGFVSVPVCFAAWLLRIPVVAHESDYSPGLANRFISRFAALILYSFPETERFLPTRKSRWVGTPVRTDLSSGDRQQGLKIAGFDSLDERPVLLVMGGSTGAERINRIVVDSLPKLTKDFRVIHLTGKGKNILPSREGYAAFEYVGEELKHLLAATDLVVGRAGANSIFEWLFLKKPMLLIPLLAGSRGDQVDNAECFKKRGWAMVLGEKNLNQESFLTSVRDLYNGRDSLIEKCDQHSVGQDSISSIVSILTGLMPRN